MSEMGWTFPLPSYSPKRAASPSIGPGDRLRLSPPPLPGCRVVLKALRIYQQAMALPSLSLLGEPDEGGSNQYPKDTWTTSILPGV